MPTVLIVLVIEDDPDVRRFITVNLSQRGYRTITAASGEDGLAQARAGRPDLILLDLKLPGVDGRATLETLRRIGFGRHPSDHRHRLGGQGRREARPPVGRRGLPGLAHQRPATAGRRAGCPG